MASQARRAALCAGCGFFIGDGAGVGKGRQVRFSSTVQLPRMAAAQGRRRACFQTHAWCPARAASSVPAMSCPPRQPFPAPSCQHLWSTARAPDALRPALALGRFQPSSSELTLLTLPAEQISGIILDNYARGRRKAVWVSTSTDLYQVCEA